MKRYVFDIETDGLLHEVTKLHSLVLYDLDADVLHSCAYPAGYTSCEEGLAMVQDADVLIGHNIIGYDLPALKRIDPSFAFKKTCTFIDTLVVSRLFWPELDDLDYAKWSHIDKKYYGKHSLAAWGERLGMSKIDYKGQSKQNNVDPWAEWSEEMQVYCEQDVKVSTKLYQYLLTQPADKRSVELEHEFALIMSRQEAFGFPFDEQKAFALVNTLKAKKEQINEELQAVFPPISVERWSEKTGKQLKTKVIVFNPGSRQQTVERLQDKYPEITFSTTEKGNPKVDDDVLEGLGKKYPEAKILAEYQTLSKRIGQISDGKEGWLKHSQKYKDGRIHGSVITNACISGRCSHRNPNMAQVPSVGHAYGEECRSLFYAPEGEYAKLVSDPSKDIHYHNACLFGIQEPNKPIEKATRDLSKRLIYCILYGGGAKKTGSIINPDGDQDEQYTLGKKTIDTFYKNLPAIKHLKDKIDSRITDKRYLVGIDGRRLQIRSRHSALNQLLQSTGAIAVKKATCILYNDLDARGLEFGKDYAFVAHVHDEIQSLVRPEHVDLYKQLAIDSFRKSGEYFNLKCPLTGEAREGRNWMETH